MSTFHGSQPLLSRSLMIYVFIIIALLAYVGKRTTELFEEKARQGVISENQSTVSLLSSHLKADISKFETGVKSLAQMPDTLFALNFSEEDSIFYANLLLDRYNETLDGDVTYLLDRDGICIASSNRNKADSFVGIRYFFRPYFQQAKQGVPSRYLTRGITSGIRGLYMSNPVTDAFGNFVGVVVIKKNLENIEKTLRKFRYCFVVSPQGIIFLSSQPAMNFAPLWQLSDDERELLEESQQFGTIQSSAVFPQEISDSSYEIYGEEKYFVSRKSLDVEGWSIILFTPIDQVLFYRYIGFILTSVLCLLAFLLFFIVYRTYNDKIRLQHSETLYKTLAERSFTSIYIITKEHRCVYANSEGLTHAGYSEEELLGKDIDELIHPDDREMASDMTAQMIRGVRTSPFECRIITQRGEVEWVLRNVTSIYYQNKPAYLVHSLVITERKNIEERAKQQSLTDQMTGLLNRRGLMIHADRIMKSSHRTGKGFLLLFIDLDGLKQINDTLGHKVGDLAIIEASEILREVFRESDIVARIGGDEFIVIAQFQANEDADAVVTRLQRKIDAINTMQERQYAVSMSVGTIYYDPEKPVAMDDLILQADEIMYKQKAAKKSGTKG